MFSLTAITQTTMLPNGEGLSILKGIDLKVPHGEHLGIVGQSSSGKSTLLNITGMFDLPDSSTYTSSSTDIPTLSDRKHTALRGDNLGLVLQQFNLFLSRTTLEDAKVPLMCGRNEKFWSRTEFVAVMLECVGLGDRLKATPLQLSDGEQQRVTITRTLVRQPQLILTDEPTGALDVDAGKIVMGLLEEVATENSATLIVITHDLKVAERGDRAFELRDGQLYVDSVLLSTASAMHSSERAADDGG